MQPITFITSNQKKADHLARLIRIPVEHIKLDLDEIQSLDLREVVEHKARQAYAKVQKPVLIEDVSLELTYLGGFPGPFIKFFMEKVGLEKICKIIPREDNNCIGRAGFGYHDGNRFVYFEGSILGKVSQEPRGKNGFGWDQIFVPHFTNKTSAELDETEYERFYTEIKPFEKVREFLLSL